MKRTPYLILSFLFLATTFQGDRLIGWVQQTIPRPDLTVRDLQFVDTLTGFIVSAKSPTDTSFIFKTTDGGNNWLTTYFDSLYLVCMDFVDKSVGYSGGANVGTGIIKKTTNGGIDWFTVSGIPYQIIEDIEFTNKDTGWISSTNPFDGGLWRTTDGGASWQTQMSASNRPSKIFFINSNTGWVIGSSNYNLYKTTNSGENWIIQYGFASIPIDIFFVSVDTGWVTGGGGGTGIMKTTNGGNNWFAANNPTPYGNSRIFFINNKFGWAGSGLSKIVATKDGVNWGYQSTPGFSHYSVCFVDTVHGWAGGGGNDILHSTDGGGPITYTGIKQNGNFIPAFELKQNYPNPFNASTRIKFSVLKPSYIELKIFNISGREITKLISGLQYNTGEYDYYFDPGMHSISSGIYFYTMKGSTTDNKEIFIDTKKLMLLK